MNRILKILKLFMFDWVLVVIFYFAEIFVNIGHFVQGITNSYQMPSSSFLLSFSIIISLVYALNKVLKIAKIADFIISQVLFLASVAGLVYIVATTLVIG
ncbi:hypothetical protein A2982_01405 [candidate division WWE3 bacterium RIFCSPLOWO2_01_FULL_39_13]|uniref:Uncharacterized protein n=1 Tax=candidate division WWE3 bacterium RIFCSPLOWO2_01_FULL_39_13 TaxID=1802624 RepID=A0A1F4V4Z7_UNCKA|nr:MAG: hypothetical protein A2982_01405 [candidate division WWE3 bacterium RIFCSPLOWO2_01_FULL_39_13]